MPLQLCCAVRLCWVVSQESLHWTRFGAYGNRYSRSTDFESDKTPACKNRKRRQELEKHQASSKIPLNQQQQHSRTVLQDPNLRRSTGPPSSASPRRRACGGPDGRSAWTAWWRDMTAVDRQTRTLVITKMTLFGSTRVPCSTVLDTLHHLSLCPY